MSNSPGAIINTLLPSAAVDSVAIFTQDYTQIFRDARVIKAVLKENSKLMEHPVESGAIITDHRVILPVEIDLSMLVTSVNYQDVYKQIRQYFFNATLLVVQTRSGIYENQLIAALPHEEDPTMYNAISIALSLKQVQIVVAQYGVVPKRQSQTTTIDRGTQQGTVAPPQSTIAQDAAHYLGIYPS